MIATALIAEVVFLPTLLVDPLGRVIQDSMKPSGGPPEYIDEAVESTVSRPQAQPEETRRAPWLSRFEICCDHSIKTHSTNRQDKMLVLISPDQSVSRVTPSTRERHVESVAASQRTKAINSTTKATTSPVQAFTGYEQSSGDRPQRERAFLAHQIMNASVLTLRPGNTVQHARELLATRPIQHIPITDDSHRLVGMMSDRDVMQLPRVEETRPLSEVMTSQLFAAMSDTSIREVAGEMVDRQIHCLPILDEDHKLLGIITTADVLKCVVNQAPLDLWV